jgi:tetratricopeptide (TPR) repeat protein
MKTRFLISNFQFLISSFLLLLMLASQSVLAGNYQQQALDDAHALFKSATNRTMYAEAAGQYEFLIHKEGIRNGDLFYNAGNSWFMAGDIGRAILNYRRAETYMPNNKDLQHNLKSAMELKSDLIPAKEPHPLATRFLGWHLNTSTAFRWWSFAIVWLLFWGAWYWMGRSAKKEARITVIGTGLVSVILLSSLITEAVMNKRNESGVITAKEILARKGNGNMYAPAFLEPLHSGTEFKQIEVRGEWRHIELPDGQTCWIPTDAGETVAM